MTSKSYRVTQSNFWKWLTEIHRPVQMGRVRFAVVADDDLNKWLGLFLPALDLNHLSSSYTTQTMTISEFRKADLSTLSTQAEVTQISYQGRVVLLWVHPGLPMILDVSSVLFGEVA